MKTLHGIRERELAAVSLHDVETLVLYEAAGRCWPPLGLSWLEKLWGRLGCGFCARKRWACLGWKSYGAGQGVDFVREDGDYQVGDLDSYVVGCLLDEGVLCQANVEWINKFNFGYTRIIVVEINGWGMRILRVSREADEKYYGTPIPAHLRNADYCEQSPNPDEFIPFACFYRINDTHLDPEHRKWVEPSDLRPVQDGR